MPSIQLVALRSTLTTLVNLHNLSYRLKMWLEVAEVPEGIEVRLTIPGGTRFVRFARTIPRADLEREPPILLAYNPGGLWIDEARASGQRPHQQRIVSAAPTPSRRAERTDHRPDPDEGARFRQRVR